jgi:hypothetical protein
MLRGNCADVARLAALFVDKGMVSNQNDRLSNSRKPPEFRSTEHFKMMCHKQIFMH